MTSPEYWSRLLIALSILGAVLATLFYLLRLYSHHLSAGKLDAGDVFLGLGLILSYGITITTIIGACKFWPPSQVCIKISIIILLRRLLGTVKRVDLLTSFLLVFTAAWGLAALLANTFQCWPPQYFWDKGITGHCIKGQKVLFMTNGSISLLEDVILLSIPIATVWRLQMSAGRKALLTMLFALGGVVCVFSLMRLIEFRKYQTGNLTASGTKERVWTLLEIDIAIVCASVVLMPPLFKRCAHTCKCSYRPAKKPPTISECALFEDHWPFQKHCTNFSHDRCSEVRAQAYRTPSVEASERRTSIAMGDIRIETVIHRDVHDRDVLWSQTESTSFISGTQSVLPGKMGNWVDDMSNVDLTGVGFGRELKPM
ncbi:hypothetical protein BDV28DRAFT_157087 [Aspergillus coremiiformis]|uniref:Rhodopsin domain-containing protein n=1 Tax=Aspergillus coremiiformis TaxID=138285 RepID=A0A5N6Z899_9EURO|nr:hypothetical protein BDV28DRAFT_157087 [Aspergillus coremiiformis]